MRKRGGGEGEKEIYTDGEAGIGHENRIFSLSLHIITNHQDSHAATTDEDNACDGKGEE